MAVYVIAVEIDDAELEAIDPPPRDGDDLRVGKWIAEALDKSAQGTVGPRVTMFGLLSEQERNTDGQMVVYTGMDQNGFEIDHGELEDPGLN